MTQGVETLSILNFFAVSGEVGPGQEERFLVLSLRIPLEILRKGGLRLLLMIIAPSGPHGRTLRVLGPRALLFCLLLIASWGCTREPERQWQKIGQPYSLAEFKRDQAACTREKKLDVECMRALGWVDVAPDLPAPSPEAPRPRGRY